MPCFKYLYHHDNSKKMSIYKVTVDDDDNIIEVLPHSGKNESDNCQELNKLSILNRSSKNDANYRTKRDKTKKDRRIDLNHKINEYIQKRFSGGKRVSIKRKRSTHKHKNTKRRMH